MIVYSDTERLSFGEYREFLTRCDLGSQYPKKDFESRVSKVLENVEICVTARTDGGLLVGIAMGITDGAYFLFLTDLGVDRNHEGQGIGSRLLQMVQDRAGGEDDITMVTISNDQAIGFYGKNSMKNEPELMVKYCRDWEPFVVE